jgi:hypothetical protein
MSNLVRFHDIFQLNLNNKNEYLKSQSYSNQNSPSYSQNSNSDQSPSYSPLESPLKFSNNKSLFQIGYLETFVECMLCVQDMIETIGCVYDMTDNVEKEFELKKKVLKEEKRRQNMEDKKQENLNRIDESCVVSKKLKDVDKMEISRKNDCGIDIDQLNNTQQNRKNTSEKAKRSFYIDINDDLELFLKLKKKESIVTFQTSLNISFKGKNDEALDEKFDNYFIQNKIFFLNLIKTYKSSLQLVKIENREELTSDLAKSYLNSYLLNQMTLPTNDMDISYLIMINICFMILDLLYNCSFNTVLWFMDTVRDKYKNLIKGICIYINR